MDNWRVLDSETLSDHGYITFKIRTGHATHPKTRSPHNKWRWNPRSLDLGRAKELIREQCDRAGPANTPEGLIAML